MRPCWLAGSIIHGREPAVESNSIVMTPCQMLGKLRPCSMVCVRVVVANLVATVVEVVVEMLVRFV